METIPPAAPPPVRLRVQFEIELPTEIPADHFGVVYRSFRRLLPWATAKWRLEIVR